MFGILRVLLVPIFAVSSFAADALIEVKGNQSGKDVPCWVALDRAKCPERASLEAEEGTRIPCQWGEPDAKGQAVLRWIEKSVEKDKVLKRRLVAETTPSPNAVEVKQGDEKVEVSLGGKPFTTYNYSPKAPKPYCWPLIGPTGRPITRAYPMVKDVPGEQTDHPHHRSWSFTFGSINGADFWAETPKSGRIVHAKFERLVSGPVFGEIVARNEWITVENKKQMEDVRTYRVYNTPDHFLVDWEVRMVATEGPVKIGDTKEGMASFRVATSMIEKNGGRFDNSDGKVNERECWGKQADWLDDSGKVEGEVVGIAFMDHPTSFRHPTYWVARGYGLFGANPFGHAAFLKDKTKDGGHTIPAGEEIVFRYRVYIHKGTAAEANVAEKYENYANPPAVTVQAQ